MPTQRSRGQPSAAISSADTRLNKRAENYAGGHRVPRWRRARRHLLDFRPPMRKTLKRFLPDHETISANRWLRPFASTLLHPRLWHLNRHSAAGAIAVGMFCGLIPGPLQMMGAAICCVLFRVNLPLALITTLYSNPLTIVPLYLLAFGIGSLILGNGEFDFTPPPDLVGMNPAVWIGDLAAWASSLGKPLFVGLIVLAASLSMLSYLAVRWGWRLWLIRQWRRRRRGARPARN